MDDNIVAIVAVFCIFGLPTLAFIIIRGLQHRERMEMIRHGVLPQGRGWQPGPANMPQPGPVRASRSCADDDDDPQRTLRKGVVVAFIGLALTIGLSFIGFLIDPPHFYPGPWLLGGLIPMFVGIAQIVTALMFGATFPMMRSGGYTVGPASRQSAMPPPPPTFDGSYTYRPDPSAQELGQSSPPDRR